MLSTLKWKVKIATIYLHLLDNVNISSNNSWENIVRWKKRKIKQCAHLSIVYSNSDAINVHAGWFFALKHLIPGGSSPRFKVVGNGQFRKETEPKQL